MCPSRSELKTRLYIYIFLIGESISCGNEKSSYMCVCVFLIFIYLFIFGYLGPSFCEWPFSSCGERGLLFIAVHGLLIAVASLVVEHGL